MGRWFFREEWSSICDFWKNQDSLNTDSTLGEDGQSGASNRGERILGNLENSSQSSYVQVHAGTSGVVLPDMEVCSV